MRCWIVSFIAVADLFVKWYRVTLCMFCPFVLLYVVGPVRVGVWESCFRNGLHLRITREAKIGFIFTSVYKIALHRIDEGKAEPAVKDDRLGQAANLFRWKCCPES